MLALTKNKHQWGFACGRVSALEGRLMGQDFFLSLAGLERIEDLFQRLQDTSLREHMNPGAVTWEDWSTIIDAYVHNLVISMRRDCPESAVADLFTLSDDYLNLKRAVQHRGVYPFLSNVFPEERLNEVAAGNVSLLPDIIRPVLAQLAGSAEAVNPMVVDMALDGAYLRHYLALGASLNAPFIEYWVRERVLARAVVVLWRAARSGHSLKMYQQHFLPLGPFNGVLNEMITASDPRGWGALIPGRVGDLFQEASEAPEEEQVVRFEQISADYLTDLARRVKMQTMGPERVAGFLWGLWVEAFNLKLVISGRLNKIDADLLKSRVRACYV